VAATETKASVTVNNKNIDVKAPKDLNAKVTAEKKDNVVKINI
jgi:hypothetical protein